MQITALFPAFAFGNGFTVTTIEAVSVQPDAFDTVTVYVVVMVGLATGFAIVVELNPVAGVHTNPVPPLAVRFKLLPIQILVEFGFIVATTPGFTVTVTEVFALQPDAFVTKTV